MGVPYAEVIGDPVGHSKSPLIHEFWLRKLGIEAEYRATRVAAGDLGAFLERRRADPDWRGCNVTIPHKVAVLPFLDGCVAGLDLEAVNCVLPQDGSLIGHNTDMSGIAKALPDHIDTKYPVCIIGAGGAARAAIAELDLWVIYQYNVIARDRPQARALVEKHGAHGRVFAFAEAADAMRGCVGLINASPLGMNGFDPMPGSVLDALPLLARHAFIIDMVYAPVRTELLVRAEAVKSRWFQLATRFHIADGLTMLIGQAEEAFALFFGRPPPPGHEAELRELLTR